MIYLTHHFFFLPFLPFLPGAGALGFSFTSSFFSSSTGVSTGAPMSVFFSSLVSSASGESVYGYGFSGSSSYGDPSSSYGVAFSF